MHYNIFSKSKASQNYISIEDIYSKVVPVLNYHNHLNHTLLENRNEPLVIQNVDLGPCIKLWTKDFLA